MNVYYSMSTSNLKLAESDLFSLASLHQATTLSQKLLLLQAVIPSCRVVASV